MGTNNKETMARINWRAFSIVTSLLAIISFCTLSSFASEIDTNSFTGTGLIADRVEFHTIESMAQLRIAATATVLQNGNVLVAGGFGVASALNGAEIYVPSTGHWHNVDNMNSARDGHTATLLPNGKVLVAGGADSESAEIFNPATEAWNLTSAMSTKRSNHIAVLLKSGKVLVTGGTSGSEALATAEIYDPITDKWDVTGNMGIGRVSPVSALLSNNSVLVAGGGDKDNIYASAELFEPITAKWIATGTMNGTRTNASATILNDGRVLVTGGKRDDKPIADSEIYNPATATWTRIPNMYTGRYFHISALMDNGKVLVAGGVPLGIKGAELYDPSTNTWQVTDDMNFERFAHSVAMLNDGRVLLIGGYYLADAEVGELQIGSTLTATLELPSGWLDTKVLDAQFTGLSSNAALSAGALSNNNVDWGDWITITAGIPITTTWTVDGEGENIPIYLRLKDINEQHATVVSGTVNVDLTKPTSSMTQLPTTSSTNVALAWSSEDTLSGILFYDLQVRLSDSETWQDVFTNTTASSTTYSGIVGETYHFRVRAKDVAGNVEDWRSVPDTSTLVDTDLPTGVLIINGGAISTAFRGVRLTLSAQNVSGSVAHMSFSTDGVTWGDWQPYEGVVIRSLSGDNGLKTIYVRFKDVADNVSAPISNTITLDTAVGTDYGFSINQGAIFVNQISVTLSIAAKQYTPQILISNDGGFAGAVWEPYVSQYPWQITQYGSYVLPRTVYVRYKELNGNISATYQDDIILDVTAPTGSVTIVEDGSNRAKSPNGKNVTLKLNATDDVSGVGGMMISNRSDFVDASWQTYTANMSWVLDENNKIYAQFKDNAGNVSQVYSAGGQQNVYLPVVAR